jgi:hypothetical protein
MLFSSVLSFLAGASSDWLHSISPRMPFVAASLFAGISFAASLIYARTERSLSHSARSTILTTHKHAPINLSSYASFGDPFWLYIAICFFAGTWYTTIHLSTNLLQAVYDVGQRSARSSIGAPAFSYFRELTRFLSYPSRRSELSCFCIAAVPTRRMAS